mmetsp:Transcript_50456/g.151967  ORF Transcript_50456/g.151967 Transcript_50456/m.151967 type:complete len:270 (+) Transcript_50456:82-891(+)
MSETGIIIDPAVTAHQAVQRTSCGGVVASLLRIISLQTPIAPSAHDPDAHIPEFPGQGMDRRVAVDPPDEVAHGMARIGIGPIAMSFVPIDVVRIPQGERTESGLEFRKGRIIARDVLSAQFRRPPLVRDRPLYDAGREFVDDHALVRSEGRHEPQGLGVVLGGRLRTPRGDFQIAAGHESRILQPRGGEELIATHDPQYLSVREGVAHAGQRGPQRDGEAQPRQARPSYPPHRGHQRVPVVQKLLALDPEKGVGEAVQVEKAAEPAGV